MLFGLSAFLSVAKSELFPCDAMHNNVAANSNDNFGKCFMPRPQQVNLKKMYYDTFYKTYCLNFSIAQSVCSGDLWLMYNQTTDDQNWKWHTELINGEIMGCNILLCCKKNVFMPGTYYCLLLRTNGKDFYSNKLYYDGNLFLPCN
ncbi:hypothetical protein NUSPORA_01940 [Nucleospora cyclopteri]